MMSTGDSETDQIIHRSTAMWLAGDLDRSLPRNAVLLCDGPGECIALTMPRDSREWAIERRQLTLDEVRQFFAAFGAHWNLVIGAYIQCGSQHEYLRINKFVYGGRRPQQWSFCMGIETPVTIRPLSTAQAASVIL